MLLSAVSLFSVGSRSGPASCAPLSQLHCILCIKLANDAICPLNTKIGCKEFSVKVLSWNIKLGQRSRLNKIVGGVKQISADIVGLQEVDKDLLKGFVPQFEALRYQVLRYESHEKSYCNLILSRYPTSKISRWKRDCAFPDLLSLARIKIRQREINFFNCHIPHGSGHGFKKIRTIDALLKKLKKTKGSARIVVGDFNEPRSESGQEIESWAYKTSASPRPTKEEKCHWKNTVNELFKGEQQHGMRDLFRSLHGYEVEEFSFRRPTPRRYDHIFGSEHFKVSSCEYLHSFREGKVSDHSPLVAKLGFLRRP